MSESTKKVVFVIAPRRSGKTWFLKKTLGIDEKNIKFCTTHDDIVNAIRSEDCTHIEFTPRKKENFKGLEKHIGEVWIRPHGSEWLCQKFDWEKIGGIDDHVSKMFEASFNLNSGL